MTEHEPVMHWVHPVETVPACMVVGTWVDRDQECHACTDPARVTCEQCRTVATDHAARLSGPAVFAAIRLVGERSQGFVSQQQVDARIERLPVGSLHPALFFSRPLGVDEQVYRTLQRKGVEVGQPANAFAIRRESDNNERGRREPRRLARLLNARWRWWHGLHGRVTEHQGQVSGETFYGCDRGHIARKRR